MIWAGISYKAYIRQLVVRTVVGGVLVGVAACLAFLRLLKGMQSAAGCGA